MQPKIIVMPDALLPQSSIFLGLEIGTGSEYAGLQRLGFGVRFRVRVCGPLRSVGVNSHTRLLLMTQGITFNWPAESRSLILGSFYYGYAVSQLPGGLLSTYWKPQHVFGLTILLSGLLCALLPFLAEWNVNLVITCRFLMGFLQVCTR